MTVFHAAAAGDYDQRIVRLVPGYALAQSVAVAIFRTTLSADARVLVAGCGTGSELIALAGAEPSWRFTAIDPSDGMLAVAQAKAASASIADRVSFHHCCLEEAPMAENDAGMSFLVSHFISDDGAKLAYFVALASRLKEDAPLLVFDYEVSDLPAEAYLHWLRVNGPGDAQARAVVERIARNWHPVQEHRLREIFSTAGLTPPIPVFQAFNYRCWLAARR